MPFSSALETFFCCSITSHLANFFRLRNYFQRNPNIMAAAPGKGAGDQPERKKKESILDLGIVDLLALHCM